MTERFIVGVGLGARERLLDRITELEGELAKANKRERDALTACGILTTQIEGLTQELRQARGHCLFESFWGDDTEDYET